MIFKALDAVFCPSVSSKALLLYKKDCVNGVFFEYRGREYWYTEGGVPDQVNKNVSFTSKRSLPEIFLATLENRDILNKIYDIDLDICSDIKVYGMNVLDSNGSATDNWVFPSQEGYYDDHSVEKTEGYIRNLLWCDILLSPDPKIFDKIEYDRPTKVICVGYDNIWYWAKNPKDSPLH